MLLKPKWYLDNKLVAFVQFSGNDNCYWVIFLFRKLFVGFRYFWVFVFYHRTHSKTRNLWKVSFLLFFEVRFFPDDFSPLVWLSVWSLLSNFWLFWQFRGIDLAIKSLLKVNKNTTCKVTIKSLSLLPQSGLTEHMK